MGCTSSAALLASKKKESVTPFSKNVIVTEATITPSEKRHVKRTWKILTKNLSEIGAKIFLRIFVLYPHVKQLFPCRDITGDALLQDPNFKGHSYRFVQAVGAAVDNIDDMDAALSPLLLRLGQQHIHFTGFQKDYFDAFLASIMDIWQQELGDKFTPTVANAWKNVFVFIMTKLKEGYHQATLGQVSESPERL